MVESITMCTVIIRVPGHADEPVRLLAVRDEDPARSWRPLGHWWEEQPRILGVKDEQAGGAWLAADPETARLSVMVNREGMPRADEITSRGTMVLDSLAGRSVPEEPTTRGFNLVEVDGRRATVTGWDGNEVRRHDLAPGTHMISHGDIQDPPCPRIEAWLPAFTATPTHSDPWWEEWVMLLRQTAHLSPGDDHAIIRDNRPHGYPTQSLMICLASVGAGGVELVSAELPEPGRWPRTMEWHTHSAA